MKSLADPLEGSIPRLEQFRMGESEIAAVHDFSLLLRGQIVRPVP